MTTLVANANARLTRWLAPSWRAFLTWFALAVLSAVVHEYCWGPYIGPAIDWINYSVVSHIAWVRLPAVVHDLALFSVSTLLLVWYQPLLLRLSVPRSVAWIAVFIALRFRWMFLPLTTNDWLEALYCIPFWAALVPVLWGSRTPPWVAFLAAALSQAARRLHTSLLSELIEPIGVPPLDWCSRFLWLMLPPVTFGAILLFGTRQIHPDECSSQERTPQD